MIAISYRRQDSGLVAGRLFDRLEAEFGKGSVFMDFDSIPYGVDFREHIKETLQHASLVVAIIGPDWVGAGNKPTRTKSIRRIDDPTDFVRLEIASALESGIPIIPVLLNNTPMPEAKTLPAELERLAFRNGLSLDTGIDFHHHTTRLIAGIRKVLNKPEKSAVVAAAKYASPRYRILTKVVCFGVLVASAVVGATLYLRNPLAGRPSAGPLPSPSARSQSVLPEQTARPTEVATPQQAGGPPKSDATATLAPTPEPKKDESVQDIISTTKERPWESSLGINFVPVTITGGPTDGKQVFFAVWETRVRDFRRFIDESPHNMTKGDKALTLTVPTVDKKGDINWWGKTGGDWKDPHFPLEAKQTDEHPVVCVSWDDANAFCAWLTDREHQEKRLPPDWEYRLPSDHEWSCAVGIGREISSQTPKEKDSKIEKVYPWGTGPPPPNAGNYSGEESRIGVTSDKSWPVIEDYNDGAPRTSPVGRYKPNANGIYDLGGNVWEWCDDKYSDSAADITRVVRGASWSNEKLEKPDRLLSSWRTYHLPSFRNDCSGFRLVVAPKSVR